MDLINFDKANYSIGATNILQDVSFTITDRTRLALVGRNGTGKTTLMRLISSEIQPTGGNLFRKRNLRIGMLHQEQRLSDELPLKDAVLHKNEEWWNLYKKLADPSLSPVEHDNAMTKFLSLGGYSIPSKAEEILNKLGFPVDRLSQSVNTLSGGERNRAAIAAALLQNPDLILLDEPTNHIDYEGLVWLADFLKNTKKPFILVSHDRHFLNLAVTQTADIHSGEFRLFTGNYDDYIKQREELDLAINKKFRQQRDMIKKTEEYIRKNIAGQKTKQAQARRKKLDKLEPLKGTTKARDFRINMDIDTRGGNKVIEIEELGYSIRKSRENDTNRVLFSDFGKIVQRGERIGVVGKNGCGKTTLFRLIAGKLPPQHGKIEIGAGITFAYYSQDFDNLPADGTPFDSIMNAAGYLIDEQIRAHLGAFSISGDNAFRPLSSFSGGERARVAMAMLVLTKANLLLLDEPTNHLDIPSRTILEDALMSYPGTALVVSHDRYFLDRVVNKIWAFEDSRIIEYTGDFSYYLMKKKQKMQVISSKSCKESVPGTNNQKSEKRISKFKLSQLDMRLKDIEREIAYLESEKERLSNLMSEPFVAGNFERFTTVSQKLQKTDDELKALWNDWESITSQLTKHQ